MKAYIIMCAAMALCPAMSAQSLQGTVEMDRDIQPGERSAVRPVAVTPKIFQPKITLRPLQAAPYYGQGDLSRALTRLEPAQTADTLSPDPYRGYLDLGYFPTFNAAANAGFMPLRTSTQRLGLCLQYTGLDYSHTYTPAAAAPYKLTARNNSLALGANYLGTLTKHHTLSARLAYTWADGLTPYNLQNLKTGISNLDLQAGVQTTTALPWNAAVRLSRFARRHDLPGAAILAGTAFTTSNFKSPAETLLSLTGGVKWLQGPSTLTLDAEINHHRLDRVQHIYPVPGVPTADNPDPLARAQFATSGGHNTTQLVLTPRYAFMRGNLTLNLGAKLQLATGSGTNFNIAPAVNASYQGGNILALWAQATGGQVLNTLESLHSRQPWLPGVFSYTRSNIPLVVKGGFNITPMPGVSARLFAGYAMANQWLMPIAVGGTGAWQLFAQNVRGAQYGASVQYSHKTWGTISAHITGASSGTGRKAWYEWDDRASLQAGATVETTLLKNLDITLEYQHRSGRKTPLCSPTGQGNMAWWTTLTTLNLGAVNNLNLGAVYRFNPALNAFVNVQNLAGHQYQAAPGVYSQKITGLMGIQFKF